MHHRIITNMSGEGYKLMTKEWSIWGSGEDGIFPFSTILGSRVHPLASLSSEATAWGSLYGI